MARGPGSRDPNDITRAPHALRSMTLRTCNNPPPPNLPLSLSLPPSPWRGRGGGERDPPPILKDSRGVPGVQIRFSATETRRGLCRLEGGRGGRARLGGKLHVVPTSRTRGACVGPPMSLRSLPATATKPPPLSLPLEGEGGGERDPPPILKDSRGVPGVQIRFSATETRRGLCRLEGGRGGRARLGGKLHVVPTSRTRGACVGPPMSLRSLPATATKPPPLSLPLEGEGGGGEGPPPYIEGLQGGPGGAKSDFPRQKPAGDSAVWRGVGEGERDSGASFTSSPRHAHVVRAWGPRCPYVPSPPPPPNLPPSLSPWRGRGGGERDPPPILKDSRGVPGVQSPIFRDRNPQGTLPFGGGSGRASATRGQASRRPHVTHTWCVRGAPDVPTFPPRHRHQTSPPLSPPGGGGGGGEGPPPYIEGLQGGPGGAKSDFPRQKPAGDSAVWRGVGEGERDSGASFTSSPRHAHVVRAWGPRCPYVPSPPPPPNLPPSLSPWRGRGGGERDPPPILKDSRGVPGVQSPIFRDRNPQGTLPFGGGSGRASATRGQASRRPHVTHTWCVRGAPDVPTFPPRHRHQTSPPLSPPGGGGGGGRGTPPLY